MSWHKHSTDEQCDAGYYGCAHFLVAPGIHVAPMGNDLDADDWFDVVDFGQPVRELFNGPLAQAKEFVERYLGGYPTTGPAPTRETDEAVEWSTDTTDSIELGKPSRTFLTIDLSGLLTLTNCLTTSSGPSGRPFNDGERSRFDVDKDDARWLIGALQAALDEQEKRGW